jgi:hypothetical protein
MADAALKIEPEYHPSRRVARYDLVDYGAFLCKRMKEHWPHLQDRQILGFLQGCSDGPSSNEYLFIRTERAFLLAQSFQEFLEPYPWIKEIFCFAYYDDARYPAEGDSVEKYQREVKDSAVLQAASLYEDLVRWAQKIGANEIIVDKYTDVPVKNDKDIADLRTIKGRIGKLYKSEEIFAQMDPTRPDKSPGIRKV